VPRLSALACLACLAAVTLPGCGTPTPPPDVARLEVRLPEFREYLDANPPIRAKLKVAGKEQVVPADRSARKLVVDVQPADFAETIELELSFWPVRYSNTFRKRAVAPQKGKVTVVDMSKPDPDQPDRFEAIYVPTPDNGIAKVIELVKPTGDDVLLDIGCGDGRVVIAAVKAGAKKGVGVDLNPDLVELSKENARKAGVADRCEFRVENALKMTDLSAYTVVFMCLGEDLQRQMVPLLKKLPKGSRVATTAHLIEGWTPPDVTTRVSAPGWSDGYPVYLWNVK
jgi:precorrin-6B methylase 2